MLIEAELPWLTVGSEIQAEMPDGREKAGRVHWFGMDATSAGGAARLRIFVDLSATETDFGRPKAVVSLGNAKATAQDFPGSVQTNMDRATWDEMDAVSDKLALIFAGDQPFVNDPKKTPSWAIV